MGKIEFAELPIIVRVMTMATIFMGWVLFAELVIDRYRWDIYLPYYRYRNVCPYELVVIAGLVMYWRYLHRLRGTDHSQI